MDQQNDKQTGFSSADEPPTTGDEGSAGIVQTQYVTVAQPPNELVLESGRRLGPIQVAYETYGRLNDQRDNAVFICHALSADAHVAGKHHPDDRKPGWWDIMIGPGKSIDTNKYFVICANILGGCKGTTGPESINPQTGKKWGLDFPVVTIEDMVKVQKLLLDALEIEQLLTVIGGSMGGMQVLEWAVRYPRMVRSAIPIATTARLGAQGIAFDAVGRNAILSDPQFNNGQYEADTGPDRGLAIARMVGHITYLSEKGMHAKFGRELRSRQHYGYDFENEFSVETYLDYQGQRFVARFDANCYLYITKAMDYYDLVGRYGTLDQAFKDVRARFLVMSFTSDWLFTPEQSQQLVDALLATGQQVSYCNIESPYGHDAFLLEPQVMGRLIAGFLQSVHRPGSAAQRRASAAYQQPPAVKSIFSGPRLDYELIEELIEPDSTVLDLGCGSGGLLKQLIVGKQVSATGVEMDQEFICQCVERGLNVLQADLDEGLDSFADGSYDYVVLSQTLQTVRRPDVVLTEMLRVGRRCIVSFPNFAHWKARLQVLTGGVVPVTGYLPFHWYDSPDIHFVSIKDFEKYCRTTGANIIKRIPLVHWSRSQVRFLPNLRAEQAIFVISAG